MNTPRRLGLLDPGLRDAGARGLRGDAGAAAHDEADRRAHGRSGSGDRQHHGADRPAHPARIIGETLRHRGIKADADTIAASLQGTWREEHLFALEQAMQRYDFLSQQIDAGSSGEGRSDQEAWPGT